MGPGAGHLEEEEEEEEEGEGDSNSVTEVCLLSSAGVHQPS